MKGEGGEGVEGGDQHVPCLNFKPSHVANLEGSYITVEISIQQVMSFIVISSAGMFQCCVCCQNLTLTGPHHFISIYMCSLGFSFFMGLFVVSIFYL